MTTNDVRTALDTYLLSAHVRKDEIVAQACAMTDAPPAAEPYVRALRAVGTRAADEAFIALRLVLAGKAVTDDAVRRLRALSGLARAIDAADVAAARVTLDKDGVALADVVTPPIADAAQLEAARSAVLAAYHAAL